MGGGDQLRERGCRNVYAFLCRGGARGADLGEIFSY